ncbi:tetratricopeptide repeat protein [Acidithiobacillus sp. IBUN Pt1247-S3]|uniref:tetratricopeptide repeat protein n=1 Tax=Acidithiobacillus sp. IBUN Pt1247-S3 TaxID=3166642 RepID=UPI0034E57BDE
MSFDPNSVSIFYICIPDQEVIQSEMILRRYRTYLTSVLVLAAFVVPSVNMAYSAPLAVSNTANPGSEGTANQYIVHSHAIHLADQQIIALLNRNQYKAAILLLQKAINEDQDAWAADTIGHLYASGLGVTADAKEAFRWYLWSAEHGGHFAQRQVANAYLNGWGTKRSPQKAAYWFRQGMAPSQVAGTEYWLAKTYAHAKLAPPNPQKVHYYKQKSVQTLRDLDQEPNGAAAYDLGIAYLYGNGVAQNRQKALTYFRQAMQLQYPKAAAAIHQLQGQGS